MIKFKPFDYQEEAIKKGVEVLTSKNKRSEVIVAPVAAGKSIIIAHIVDRIRRDGNVLVIQPNKELTIQNIKKAEALGMEVSVYSASLKRKELGNVTYATPGSIKVKDFKKFGFKYCLIDECDSASKSGTVFKEKVDGLGFHSILGLTASPIYLNPTIDGSVLKMINRVRGKMFKDICHVIQVNDLTERKRWSDLEYKQYEFDTKGLIMNTSGSDFTEDSIVNSYIENNSESKIESILKTLGNESSLIFVPGIENVDRLHKKIKDLGLKVVKVHSKLSDEEREYAINSFLTNENNIMVNSLVLVAGFDKPDLNNIIDAYPTNSARINYQKIGRGVRVHETKSKAVVHCISGNYNKFGSIEHITFENVDNFGWGMFVKGRLLTGIPMRENINITIDDIKNGKVTKNSIVTNKFGKDNYDFTFQNEISSDVFPIGKYKGKTIKNVYETDKNYLEWMYKKIKSDNAFSSPNMRKIVKQILEIYDKKL